MNALRLSRRSALLALSLLSGCAASGAGRSAGPAGHPDIAVRQHAQADTSSGTFLIGRLAGQQGDLDIAAEAFLEALAADPGQPELEQQAFLACLLTGRPETERLARGQPDNAVAQLFLADVAAQQGNWAEAEQRVAAFPRQGLTQVLQPLVLAWTQAGGGRANAGLATLRPYVEGDHFRGIYALHAGLIADLGHRDPEAARLYRVAEESFGGLNLELARVIASWQARQGNPGAAAKTLDALATDSPDLAIALPGLRRDVATRQVRNATDGMAEAYLAMAAALRTQDAGDDAALLLRLALDLRPDLTGARLLSSEMLAAARHPEAALTVLRPVAPDDPLAPLVDLRRAALLDRLGRTDEALTVLVRVQKDDPARPEPWAMQGGLLRQQHRYGDAVAAFDQAVQRVPNPGRVNWPLFYERGVALEQAHRWPEAEADFRRALALSPDEPSVLNYLGYSWTEQGANLAEARRMVERAVTQRPNDGAIADSLGWIQLHQGDVAAAVKQLEHAVELEPEDATINGHLGDAYAAAGRRVEAEFQWQRALTLNPEPGEAARIQSRMHEAAVAPANATTADSIPKGTP